MSKGNPRDLPRGITPKTRTKNGKTVPVVTQDGTPVYRVRVWDAVLKKQIERTAEGLDAAKHLLEEFNEAKRRPGRLQAERVRFVDVAARYLVAYKTKRDGTPRPKSSLAKERSCLNIYIIPVLGNAWIGDLDLPDLNETIRGLTLQDGSPASGSTKSTVASVVRRLFAWAREERIIRTNPALELRTGWGSSVRRRVLIPSIPQVMRLAEALDHFKPGLGDVAMVLAFTGLRWEEAVAVPIENVASTASGSWSTGPPANQAGAVISAPTSRRGPPNEPSPFRISRCPLSAAWPKAAPPDESAPKENSTEG